MSPGVYTVRILLNRIEVFRLDCVQIRSGETARPEALRNLVVGHNFDVGLVTALAMDGEPHRNAWLDLESLPQRSAEDPCRITNDFGQAALVYERGKPYSLSVRTNWKDPNGVKRRLSRPWFPVVLRTGKSSTPQLSPAENETPVEFKLTLSDPLPISKWWVRLMLIGPAAQRRAGARAASAVNISDKQLSLNLSVPFDGNWDLVVRRRGLGGADNAVLLTTFHIDEKSSHEVFVDIDAAMMKALQRLARVDIPR